MKKTMDIERFKTLVAAYGAETGRWPQAERRAAQDLAANSQEAQRLLGAARGLDRLLDRDEIPGPSDALRRAVLAIPDKVRAKGGWTMFMAWLLNELGGWRPVAAGLAAAFVIGLALGNLLYPATDQSSHGLMQLAFMNNAFTGF